jgi:uncharacterized protein
LRVTGSRAERTGEGRVNVTETNSALAGPDGSRRLAILIGIGLVAGLFSAVFGVGGGIIVVPLLISLLAYDSKVATATSLGGIILTATWGTIAHGALGNVDWGYALLIGIPAMAGVTLGVSLKQRLSSTAVTYGFCVLLVAVAVRMVLQ